MDLIIPFAACLDQECQARLPSLALPQLRRFLQTSRLVRQDLGEELDFIPAHERVRGLSTQLQWTPCHWSVGIDHIVLDHPDCLQLDAPTSQQLLQAIEPLVQELGLALQAYEPTAWRAQSRWDLPSLPLASLDRVIGRSIEAWIAQTPAGKDLRRLQNEIQMLLYTHPINQAREAQGLPSVNSVWISYALEPLQTHQLWDDSLRAKALHGDWDAWVLAWQQLDAKLPELGCNTLTLCGERHAYTYARIDAPSWMEQLRHMLPARAQVQSVLAQL